MNLRLWRSLSSELGSQITLVCRELCDVHRATCVWFRMRPLLCPRAPVPAPAGRTELNLGLTQAVKRVSHRGVLMCRRQELSKHDCRHLFVGMSHVRSVPLTLTMRFYQPRAGYDTDEAVLAKLARR